MDKCAPYISRLPRYKVLTGAEEIFGPAFMLFKFKNEEEAIRLANDTVYGLG